MNRTFFIVILVLMITIALAPDVGAVDDLGMSVQEELQMIKVAQDDVIRETLIKDRIAFTFMLPKNEAQGLGIVFPTMVPVFGGEWLHQPPEHPTLLFIVIALLATALVLALAHIWIGFRRRLM